MYPLPDARLRFLSRQLAWIAALATLLSCAVARADAPTALANPCTAAPAAGLLATTTNRAGLIDLYYFRTRGSPVSQVAASRPDVTILSIGANEGFAVRVADGATVECCEAP